MKRKPKKSELLLLFLLSGIGLTLALDPNLFASHFSRTRDSRIYFLGGQATAMWVSIGLAIAVFASFYTRNTVAVISLIIASFSFLLSLTVNAISTYPNLLTIFMVGTLAMVINDLFAVIDESEDRKKQHILEAYIDEEEERKEDVK